MKEETAPRRRRPDSHLFFFVVFGMVIFLPHLVLLHLPGFWDEIGQFIPAALDLYNDGAWVPRSALPNVHPPGVMAYLALVWQFTGFSLEATRAAMLLLATAGVYFTFLLALRLCGNTQGFPALPAAAFLMASPLFVTQSMMAQLDMPAMVFTVIALWLALSDRWRLAATVCIALVLVKETSLIVPLVLGAWLAWRRRWRDAIWFALPVAALAVWLSVLYRATGSIFGNQEFATYNISYALQPAHVLFALLRRLHYLGLADFHWVGALAVVVVLRRGRLFGEPQWQLCGWVVLAHVVVLSAVGGAVLERYLLPILPLLYIAFAAAFTHFPRRWQISGQALLLVGLLGSNFLNPPYPFPFENNLAMVDMVKLHQQAAGFLMRELRGARVTTAWPLSAALRRAEFGYVEEPLPVQNMADFTPAEIAKLAAPPEVFVLYSREWRPRWNLLEWEPLRALRQRYYNYQPPVDGVYLERTFGLQRVLHLERNSQWVEIYVMRRTSSR